MSNEGGRGGMAAESWEVNSTKKKIDRNVVARSIVQEPEVESGPIGSGTGVNGSDDGHGAFVSASQTALKPKWLKNFIREEDYPLSARRSGVDGQVVLEVLIDEHGAVRDARLLKGADEALNQLALAKIHEAIFSPAYDASGQAVACKVVVPIRFHLK
jgi:protein TonB